MESKKANAENESPVMIRYLLVDIMNRLADIDNQVSHVIDVIHEHLYGENGNGPGGETQ